MTRYRKSWTEVIEEVIINEALKKIDKDVIDAFYYRKEKEGKVVSTDGDTLTKLGMGGQQIAKWVGRKVKITAVSDVKSTESILKYMKKSIPSGLFEEVEIDEKFAGWIAFYNKEKLEIKPKKGEIDSLYDAKQAAIKHFKVPKSKQGLLAIEPAHEEVEEKVDMDKAGYGGSRHKKIEKDKYNKKRKGQGIEDETELDEKGTAYPATVDTLRKIVKDKQHQTVMFDKGQAIVDLFSASAMVQVYDALKPATKKKFEAMIKSKEGFMKSQAFAMKMAK